MTIDEVNRTRKLLGLPPIVWYVDPMTAAGVRDFKEWLHPRDRMGRWIEKLSRVKVVQTGAQRFGGVIESLNRNGTARIRITWSGNKRDIGQRVDVPASNIETIDAKAVLDTPPPGEVKKSPQKPWAPLRPVMTGTPVGDGTWKGMKDALDSQDVVVFDTETTGFDVAPGGKDKVVELGAVRIRKGKIVDRFQTMVNPGRPIDPEATAVSGIGDDDVKDAPSIQDAYKQLKEFAGDAILGAHNANFDMDAINSMAYDSGEDPLPNSVLDTLALARQLLKTSKKGGDIENHKLGTLSDYFGINLDNWHRADADAEAAGLLVDKLLQWAIDNDAPIKAIQNLDQQIEDWKRKLDEYERELDTWRNTTQE